VIFDEIEGNLGSVTQGENVIHINSSYLGADLAGTVELASIMSHEGTHMYGNRVEGVAHTYGAMTYEAVANAYGVEKDENFESAIKEALCNPDSWKENEGKVDYWRVTKDKDGNVVNVQDDGDKSIITFVDEKGKILEIEIAKGSLTQQIANSTNGKQSKSVINNLMAEKYGLDFASDKGWFAKEERAVYKGENSKNGNFWNRISNSKDKVNQLKQDFVEDNLNQNTFTACAVAASADMNNEFLKTFSTSNGLNNTNMVNALNNAKGTMFEDKTSWVNSFNGLNAYVSAKAGTDNYLMFSGYYNSTADANNAGLNYYLVKYTNVDNPNKTHFVSYSNGSYNDPFNYKDKLRPKDKWWNQEGNYTYQVYGFTPKF